MKREETIKLKEKIPKTERNWIILKGTVREKKETGKTGRNRMKWEETE